jgi:hypothetical protein
MLQMQVLSRRKTENETRNQLGVLGYLYFLLVFEWKKHNHTKQQRGAQIDPARLSAIVRHGSSRCEPSFGTSRAEISIAGSYPGASTPTV